MSNDIWKGTPVKDTVDGVGAFFGFIFSGGFLAICMLLSFCHPAPAVHKPILPPDETVSHLVGRKSRESIVEFSKGIIGLDSKLKPKQEKDKKSLTTVEQSVK